MSIFEQFEKIHYSDSIDTSNSIVISDDGKIFVSKKLKKLITKSSNTYKIYYNGGYLEYNEMISMQNYLSVVCYASNFVLLLEDGKLVGGKRCHRPLRSCGPCSVPVNCSWPRKAWGRRW